MKKVLSVLCMALLAGGMIFTSCTKTKQYTITVKSNNEAWGTVTGGGIYDEQAVATLTATPKEGYQFVQWQDNSKENPRKVTVTQDETWTAFFEAIPTPPPANPGVKVTFNGSNWDASSIQALYYTDYGIWDVYSMQTQGSLPIADVATSVVSGSSSSQADATNGELSGNFNWIEYYNETYLQDDDGTYYGDYWAKTATCVVTAFDATALTLTSNVNATMFSAYEAFIDGTGVDAASTAPMAVNMSSVELNASKGKPSKKVVGKLVAVK